MGRLFRRVVRLLIMIGLAPVVASLSMTKPRPVRRVAIVGAGIAGLAVAHALNPVVDEICIFDSRPAGLDQQTGAGLQLNGGLAAMDPVLREKVYQAGTRVGRIKSRTRRKKSQDNEHVVDPQYRTLFEIELKDAIRSDRAAADALILPSENDGDEQILWISIMRSTLQQTLLDSLPAKRRVSFNKKLTGILIDNDGLASCEFSDGSSQGPFDLVVGCDGIRSVVKQYIDGGTTSKKGGNDAIYSGIRIKYAVRDGKGPREELEKDGVSFVQYFGDGLYGLFSTYGAGPTKAVTRCAYLIYLDPEFAGPFRIRSSTDDKVEDELNENADWNQDVRRPLADTKQSMLNQISDCNLPDENRQLQETIQNADGFFDLGSYFHNPFSKWSRCEGRSAFVLCGDSAHALPPFLGQGANQAIQDAYCLAEQIENFNAKVGSNEAEADIETALTTYRNIRWPPVFSIFTKSIFLGYLETGGSNGLYSVFRDLIFQVLGFVGVAKKVLLSAAVPSMVEKE